MLSPNKLVKQGLFTCLIPIQSIYALFVLIKYINKFHVCSSAQEWWIPLDCFSVAFIQHTNAGQITKENTYIRTIKEYRLQNVTPKRIYVIQGEKELQLSNVGEFQNPKAVLLVLCALPWCPTFTSFTASPALQSLFFSSLKLTFESSEWLLKSFSNFCIICSSPHQRSALRKTFSHISFVFIFLLSLCFIALLRPQLPCLIFFLCINASQLSMLRLHHDPQQDD